MLNKDLKTSTLSDFNQTTLPNTRSLMHLTITREHDSKSKKNIKYDVTGEGGNHMTDTAPINNLIPPPEEDQDSDKFDDNEDSARGLVVYEREEIDVISQDSKDSEFSGESQATLSKDDENLEKAMPESKEENNNASDALGAKP